jgi:hypothetical protein
MSEIERRHVPPVRAVEVVNLSDVDKMLIGPPDRIDLWLTGLRNTGQLVKASHPVPDGRPGLYAVTVRLAPVVVRQAPAPRRTFWTPRRVGVAAGVGLAVLAGVGVLGYMVLSLIVAHLAAVLAVLVLGGLVAGAFGPRVCKTVVTIKHWH